MGLYAGSKLWIGIQFTSSQDYRAFCERLPDSLFNHQGHILAAEEIQEIYGVELGVIYCFDEPAGFGFLLNSQTLNDDAYRLNLSEIQQKLEATRADFKGIGIDCGDNFGVFNKLDLS